MPTPGRRGRTYHEREQLADERPSVEPGELELADAVKALRELKARDLAAKRSGDHDQRPELGRAIYDLVRAIMAAREARNG